jgi:hypothetical protein
MKEQEKDAFYDEVDEMVTNVEELDPSEVFNDDDLADTPEANEEGEEKPDWQLSKEEDDKLKELLEKKQREDTIMKTFLTLQEKPSQEVIDSWKKQFGDVYLMSLGEKMNFIFRPIKRIEWRQLMSKAGKLTEIQQTEMIVQKAVVWPVLAAKDVQVLTGGAPEALRDVILEASHFMPPERAMVLVRQL